MQKKYCPKTAVGRCSSRKMFLKISQYSWENTCIGVFFLKKLQAWRQETCFPANIVTFFKATFFIDHFQWTPHRTFLIQMPQGVLSKKILKNFERLTGKHLCQSLLFNKVAGLGPASLLKKRLRIGVFLKILKNTFFTEHV